jgi:hypothetical protein
MLNTMFNIREKTGANRGKQDIAVLSMFIEILRTAATANKRLYVSLTAKTWVRVP